MKRWRQPEFPWWCAAALFVLAGAVVWTAFQLGQVRRWTRSPIVVNLDSATHVPPMAPDPQVVRTLWPEQAGRADGNGDIFTPPSLWDQLAAGRAGADGPSASAGGDRRQDLSPGCELIEVKPEPYPLQLVGHAGSGRSAKGIFAWVETGESVLAKAGSHFTGQGLMVQTFEVKSQRVALAEGPDIRQTIATAVVLDLLSGETVTLDSRERTYRDAHVAVIRLRLSGGVRDVREGDFLETAAGRFRVERILGEPPSLHLIRKDDGDEFTLRLNPPPIPSP